MANKVILGALAVIPGALALGSVLNLTTPAHAFELEHSQDGAGQIVKTRKSEAPAAQLARQTETRRSTIFVRGHHGAQKIVTEEGVGGSSGEYKGFPKLEQRGSHGGYRLVND
ncbi:hypothetical protein C1752_04279 [Acaryochloris thomasi RCC1774]|uniref:Uncharacterized protein n=1 Tax=Acaryochloris thomasi RCC1774 TaxID=1764569 RepID=A0A2W1JE60_9CYAN|nr:hypothetical protein [Acaryochloris thomasi]PZD71988.1 hypothetical protein C1752_04279 [Acaryochloris thomasi RCC1774]